MQQKERAKFSAFHKLVAEERRPGKTLNRGHRTQDTGPRSGASFYFRIQCRRGRWPVSYYYCYYYYYYFWGPSCCCCPPGSIFIFSLLFFLVAPGTGNVRRHVGAPVRRLKVCLSVQWQYQQKHAMGEKTRKNGWIDGMGGRMGGGRAVQGLQAWRRPASVLHVVAGWLFLLPFFQLNSRPKVNKRKANFSLATKNFR